MGRIRSVHPGLFTDEAFMGLSAHARVLFIGLWTECDDQGAFEWKPLTIKMRLLPADMVDTVTLLAELEGANVIRGYSYEGKKYGLVRNFGRFQRPRKPKATHFVPHELRAFVALDAPGDEQCEAEADEIPQKSEQRRRESGPRPKKSGNHPQMEDGGWTREEPSQGSTDREKTSPLAGKVLALPGRSS